MEANREYDVICACVPSDMVSGAIAAASQRYISMLWKEAAIGMSLGLVSTRRGGTRVFLVVECGHHFSVRFQILICYALIVLGCWWRLVPHGSRSHEP